MADMLARNAIDPRRDPLPEGEYICRTVAYKRYGVDEDGVDGGLRVYISPIEGEFEGVYDEPDCQQGRHSSFLLKDATRGMLQKRLDALQASNPGTDLYKAWREDDWDAFVGLACTVTYKKKPIGLVQDKVLPCDPMWSEYIKATYYPKTPSMPEPDMPFHDDNGNTSLGYIEEPWDEVDPEDEEPQAPWDQQTPQGPVMYVDSMQNAGYHDVKHQALEDMGYQLIERRLDVGDYMLVYGADLAGMCEEDWEGHPHRTVDSKRSLYEASHNVDGPDAKRFEAEMVRAEKAGVELLVLVTEPGINSAQDIIDWRPGECLSCTKYLTGKCDPTDRFWNCLNTLDGVIRPRPLCGKALLEALDGMAKRHGVQVRFVDDEEQAAAVISAWLEGRC